MKNQTGKYIETEILTNLYLDNTQAANVIGRCVERIEKCSLDVEIKLRRG